MTPAGVIEDGCIAIQNGRILAVGPTRDLNPPATAASIDGLLTPGLVNAHTHLELSDRLPGERPTEGFAGWLVGMLQRSHTEASEMEKLVAEAIRIGVDQCLRFGVTAVGDISRQCHLTRPLLRESPLRTVSFGEVQAMAQRRNLLQERTAVAIDDAHSIDQLRIGITPHAPYSVEADGYRYCLDLARQRGLPLTTHLAESADEAPFLADHSGALRRLWDWIGAFDEQVPTFDRGPIAYAESLGLLAYPSLLAHVNYCSDSDLDLLAAGQASVVWCPRTHDYFGHPPHRWRAMRERGIRVCVGTDSCASSPDLNVVDDLRLVRRQNPDVSASELWPLITSEAADALRWNRDGDEPAIGRLAIGAAADWVAWPTRSNDPLAEVLDESKMLPTQVRPAEVPSPGIAGRG
ncbi:MAG: atzA [Phycisphaerales bacterium]|nr:atzA [Phycisphaerales bacterium]